ncbi:hypothetical protein RvY_17112 [Ramazzottius varieornatus]|uniref:EGF-like domain-containing protein n=1 Tax=Ramazzottius varieornatus TaxID=947166 RepID=A0A1D1W1H2_RAMVA|nr:hypothetical protein RvY_17112 [Ramazzottius varieornatus]
MMGPASGQLWICWLIFTGFCAFTHSRSFRISPAKADQPLPYFTIDGQLPTSVLDLSFRFKTSNPNGVLLHLIATDSAHPAVESQLLLQLKDGKIDMSHTAKGENSAAQEIAHLADNQWHELHVIYDPLQSHTVQSRVDKRENPTLTLKLGSSGGEYAQGAQYNIHLGGASNGTASSSGRLEGCISDVQYELQSSSDGMVALDWKELPVTNDAAYEECQEVTCPCLHGGVCLEGGKCDCSPSTFEGPTCASPDVSVITLNGDQYVHYKQDGDQTTVNSRLAWDFKTYFSEAFLMSGSVRTSDGGESSPISLTVLVSGKYLHISLHNGAVPSQVTVEDTEVSDGRWHSLVLEAKQGGLSVKVDSYGENHVGLPDGHKGTSLLLLPEVLLGGIDQRQNTLHPDSQPFVGCLRRVYLGSTNILESLRNPRSLTTFLKSTTGRAIRLRPADVVDQGCEDIRSQDLAVTLASLEAAAVIALISAEPAHSPLDIAMDFRIVPAEPTPRATIISADLQTQYGAGDFKVDVGSNGLVLGLNYPDQAGNMQQLYTEPLARVTADGNWHSLQLKVVDQANSQAIVGYQAQRVRRQDDGSADKEGAGGVAPMASDEEAANMAVDSQAISSSKSEAEAVSPAAVNLSPSPTGQSTEPASQSATQQVSEQSQATTQIIGFVIGPAVTATTDSSINSSELVNSQMYRLRLAPMPEDDPNSIKMASVVAQRVKVSLLVDGQAFELSPATDSMLLRGPLTIGRRGEASGFSGCVRHIRQADQLVDGRTVANAEGSNDVALGKCGTAGPTCESSNPCQHGSLCRNGIMGATCQCDGSGYSGKTCAIPSYMQTCTDLFLAGERRSGVHIIDLDGSGPMKPTFVYCNMTSEPGTTVVTHNFHPVELKTSKLGAIRYAIQYRQFDQEDSLKKLVDISQQCRQFISYKCRMAPLKLGTHTWFRSAHETGNVTSFGSDTPGKCSCATGGTLCAMGTSRDLPCNCDADDGTNRVDEGYFTSKEFVGITNMTFINRPIRGAGTLSLGALECLGKSWIERTVSFMSHTGSLQMATLKDEEDISFFYKTNLKQAVLIYQPGVTTKWQVNSFRIAQTNETTVTLFISFNGIVQALQVATSGKRLNNGAWHLVKVEFGSDELRLSVDLNSAYMSWSKFDRVGQYVGVLHVGGYPADVPEAEPGLIGCIKGFFRGGVSVDVEAAVEGSHSQDIRRGCQSSCSPNPCQNGAECFDKFGSFECLCANPLAQSGPLCQIDINTKAITFESPDTSYMQFRTIPVENMFNEDLLLSFRSHSPSGILLYAHDNVHNFMQLHLWNSRQLIFTFNNGNRIKSLTVTDDSFTDGRWHQVHVQRQDNGTTVLTVDYHHSASLELAEGRKYITAYTHLPFDKRDLALESIVPSRPYYAIANFKNVYVGGVARPQLTTNFPGWYGCIRGVKIGQHLFDLAGEADSERSSGVVDDCHASCDRLNPCSHGGRCVNNWGNVTVPTECICRNTSYGGATCTDDIGANFDASSCLVVAYSYARGQAFDISKKLRLALTFSTAVVPQEDVAMLFVQTFQKLTEIVIGLTTKGEVIVDVLTEEASRSREVIAGNFADGQRHHVQVEIGSAQMNIQVDGTKREVGWTSSQYPGFVQYVTIGGIDIPVRRSPELEAYKPYSGCLSNPEIDLVYNTDKVGPLTPLETALRNESSPGTTTRFTGAHLEESACAAPILPPVLVGLVAPTDSSHMQTELQFPQWNVAPAVAEEYQAFPAAPTQEATPAFQRNTAIIVGVICGIFLLAALIAVIIYMCRIRRRGRNQYSPSDKIQENEATDALLLKKHGPMDESDFHHLEKVPKTAFNRPVTNYIDENILPPSPRARVVDSTTVVDTPNGTTVETITEVK